MEAFLVLVASTGSALGLMWLIHWLASHTSSSSCSGPPGQRPKPPPRFTPRIPYSNTKPFSDTPRPDCVPELRNPPTGGSGVQPKILYVRPCDYDAAQRIINAEFGD